jgi:hypothetical protein
VPRPDAHYWRGHQLSRNSRQSFIFKWPCYFFWTSEREQMLATAAAAGFDVSAEQRSIEPPEPPDTA